MCQMSLVMCHVSCVTCHMSRGTCHVAHVTCHVSLFFLIYFLLDKLVKLVVGGSVINGAMPSSFSEWSWIKQLGANNNQLRCSHLRIFSQLCCPHFKNFVQACIRNFQKVWFTSEKESDLQDIIGYKCLLLSNCSWKGTFSIGDLLCSLKYIFFIIFKLQIHFVFLCYCIAMLC